MNTEMNTWTDIPTNRQIGKYKQWHGLIWKQKRKEKTIILKEGECQVEKQRGIQSDSRGAPSQLVLEFRET